jgi:glycosyltransferase involved in cell wall biosynthesis
VRRLALGGAQSERKLIVIAGGLSKRKSVQEVLAAASQLSSEYVLLLAGAADPEVRNLLASKKAQTLRAEGRLVTWTRYHTDAEIDAIVMAADVLCLVYRNVGPSALLLKAIIAKTPVVTSRNKAVVDLVAGRRLGVVVDQYDPGQIAVAIAGASGMADSVDLLRDELILSASRFAEQLIDEERDARPQRAGGQGSRIP